MIYNILYSRRNNKISIDQPRAKKKKQSENQPKLKVWSNI